MFLKKAIVIRRFGFFHNKFLNKSNVSPDYPHRTITSREYDYEKSIFNTNTPSTIKSSSFFIDNNNLTIDTIYEYLKRLFSEITNNINIILCLLKLGRIDEITMIFSFNNFESNYFLYLPKKIDLDTSQKVSTEHDIVSFILNKLNLGKCMSSPEYSIERMEDHIQIKLY